MAVLLLVDGVSWRNQQAVAVSFLSSLHRPDSSLLRCCRNRNSEASSPTTARCASASNLIDRLDPQLPHFPSQEQSIKGSEDYRTRVILEYKPNWNQFYVEESLATSKEPSLTEPWNNLEQPSSPGNGDTSNKITTFTDGQEIDIRRSRRIAPSYLSVSQSRRAMTNGATLQLVPTPLQFKGLKGPSGFYVGFAAMILGVMAVLRSGGLLGINSPPTALCSKCDGYGMTPCTLCKGRGSVTWEGKLKHTHLCPSCFGSLIRKCADCGGYRMRSDEPPFLQEPLKSRSANPSGILE